MSDLRKYAQVRTGAFRFRDEDDVPYSVPVSDLSSSELVEIIRKAREEGYQSPLDLKQLSNAELIQIRDGRTDRQFIRELQRKYSGPPVGHQSDTATA